MFLNEQTMHFKNCYFILLILFFFKSIIFAQQPAVSETDRIEFNTARSEEEPDESLTGAQLNFYSENPLDINIASEEELSQLGLSVFQVSALLAHRKRFGLLESVYELQAVQGFDLNSIYAILPFIKVEPKSFLSTFSINKFLKESKKQVLLRIQRVLEPSAGYLKRKKSKGPARPPAFAGNQYKVYMRFRMQYGNKIRLGITCEKDPGEAFMNGALPGFDFNSAHLYVQNNKGVLKSIGLGDYQMHFGQGLLTGAGQGFGKSSDVINIRKFNSGFRPYTATNENAFMRGAAMELSHKSLVALVFYSDKQKDARLVTTDSLSEEEEGVASLLQSGLHRTKAEIANRQVLGETVFGGHLALKKANFSIGCGALKVKYDMPFEKHKQAYKKFDFVGNENFNFGLDYNFSIRNFNFFGEAARSQNGGLAGLFGFVVSLDAKISLACLYRNYQVNYWAPFANGFGERNKTANEKGFYSALQCKLSPVLSLSLYADFFKFPYQYYQSSAPSFGEEYLMQINYSPSKVLRGYVRCLFSEKQKNSKKAEGPIDFLVAKNHNSYRVHFDFNCAKTIRLQSRVEYTQLQSEDHTDETGFLLYQDIGFSPMGSPFAFNLRYTIFDTDSYAARVYAYENDILYVYAVPAYYNRGDSFYINAQLKFYRNYTAWMGYRILRFDNKTSIGTGVDAIEGPIKTELKAQLRMEF
jgi:hypothetical protein